VAAIPILAFFLAAALQPVRPSPAPTRAEPVNPLYAYIRADDYPAAALRAEEQGRVEYRLDVSADGMVRGCTITVSSSSPSLDAATCRILRARVRFVPARDRQGRFVTDTYASSIAWSLREDPQTPASWPRTPLPPVFGTAPPVALPARRPGPIAPPPAGPRPPQRAAPMHSYPSYIRRADYPAAARRNGEEGQVYFQLTIGANGRVTDCVIAATSGSPTLDGTTCRILRSRARYAPARDAAGTPVPDTDRGTFVWRLPG
jgi:TonB family protein